MNEKIKGILAQFGKEKSNLLPILQKIEEQEKGISPEAISEVSCYLDLSENFTYSVVTFYPHLHLTEAAGQSQVF
jgi:NADH:ubiquinone oxidoreductase subunit E